MIASERMILAGRGIARGPGLLFLWTSAVVGVLAAAGMVAFALTSSDMSQPGLRAVLVVWVMLPFVLGGLIAWRRRPDSRFGPLMVVAGFALFVSTLQWANVALLRTSGYVFDMVPAALFLHLFLAFPTGRLTGRTERVVVVAAYVATIGLQVVKIVLGSDPGGLLGVVAWPGVASVVEDAQLLALSALVLVGVLLLGVERRRAGPSRRRPIALLIDCFALGLVMLAGLYVAGAFQWPIFEVLRLAAFGILGLAPVAFLIGLLDARLARAGVGDLIVELRAEPAPQLRGPLARALRDPSLTLAFWLPEFGSWADEDGRGVTLPDSADDRATTVIYRGGEPMAALVHDRSLADERELVESVSAAAGIALENGHLQAELRARLQELQGSRSRVLEAGQRERQRLERNLHDGAQQRLVALSLELGMLGDRPGIDSDARARVAHAKREVAVSLEELREVAQGIHPAVLSGHGLAVALESLAARAPVPVRLVLGFDGRLPEPIEVAVYYVVSESLANVGKHARAGSASIEVARVGGRIVVEVVDDGIGGADTEQGTGLRGLADRVEALDGRLRVWTPLGGGTRVRAEIPCR